MGPAVAVAKEIPPNPAEPKLSAGEDVRDPLFVCSELIRVSKAGYVETPSRIAESCVGWESDKFAGLCHHRWLIDYRPARLVFTQKYHNIHGDPSLHLPKELYHALSEEERISSMFWTDRFSFSETILVGIQNIQDFLRAFADENRSRTSDGHPRAS
jgi:hypothetical protein